MAKAISNILLFVMVIVGLGAALIFVPSTTTVWFREIDHVLDAGLFAMLAGVSIAATALLYSGLRDAELFDIDSGLLDQSAQFFRSAFTYFCVGLLLALTLDPLVEITTLTVNEGVPRAIDETLDAKASILYVYLHALIAFAYTLLSSIWVNIAAFVDIAFGLFFLLCGFAFLGGVADALRDNEDPGFLLRLAQWLSGQRDS